MQFLGILGCLPQILFFAAGIVQWFAVVDGIQLYTGWAALLSYVVSFFLTFFPLVGAGVGIYGAHFAWGWDWLQAIALVAWPLALYAIIAIILLTVSLLKRKFPG